jgi:hypothetical protein
MLAEKEYDMRTQSLGTLLIASLCAGCVCQWDVRMAARESGAAAGREALQRDWRMQTYDAQVVHIVNHPPPEFSSSGYHGVVYTLRCIGYATQEIDYVEGTIGDPRFKVGDSVKVKVAVEKTANTPPQGSSQKLAP